MNRVYFCVLISITIFFCWIMQKKNSAIDTAMWFGDNGLGLTEI